MSICKPDNKLTPLVNSLQLLKHRKSCRCVAGGPQSFLNILPFQKAQSSFVTLEQSILPAFVPPKPLDRVLKGVKQAALPMLFSALNLLRLQKDRVCCQPDNLSARLAVSRCTFQASMMSKQFEPAEAWHLFLSCRNFQQTSTGHTARPEAGSGPTVSELRAR